MKDILVGLKNKANSVATTVLNWGKSTAKWIWENRWARNTILFLAAVALFVLVIAIILVLLLLFAWLVVLYGNVIFVCVLTLVLGFLLLKGILFIKGELEECIGELLKRREK